jgi:hypothetical protein
MAYGRFLWSSRKQTSLYVEVNLEERVPLTGRGQIYIRPKGIPKSAVYLLPAQDMRNLFPGIIFDGAKFPTSTRISDNATVEINRTLDFRIEDIEFKKGSELPECIQIQFEQLHVRTCSQEQLFLVCKQSSNFVVISCSEIFRLFYARSRFLLQRILDTSILTADTEIWRINRSLEIIEWADVAPPQRELRFVSKFAFCEYARLQAEKILLWLTQCPRDELISIRALPASKKSDLRFTTTAFGVHASHMYVHALIEEEDGEPFNVLKSFYKNKLSASYPFPKNSSTIRAITSRKVYFSSMKDLL